LPPKAAFTALFATEPAKIRPHYANFAITDPPLKLILIEDTTQEPGSINHLGTEVASLEDVEQARDRLTSEGLATTTEAGVSCCYALQDKLWLDAPGGKPWADLHGYRRYRDSVATVLLLNFQADCRVLVDQSLWRRLFAEFLGSGFLAATVVGSGIAAQRLSPGDVGLQLFENAAATGLSRSS
jgi:hypothetical protein